jgi:polysaccharide biosynthesis protein PelG
MAGIGFELQRVLRKGGIGSFLQVALAGAMITAGPWLLSVAGIFFIGKVSGPLLAGAQRLFVGAVSYSFAFGLVLFGGSHYVFTRLVADMVYEEKKGEAGGALLRFGLLTAAVALVVGIVAAILMDPELPRGKNLFRAAAALLFVLVNLNWVLMIFASLLRRFARIFLAYAAGMATALLGVAVLTPTLGLAGALLGFDLGQLLIVVALAVMSFRGFPPARVPLRVIFGAFRKSWYLFLSGTFYYWGIWADKIVYWITLGNTFPGTFVRTYDPYDIPVFFANLAMIPGLVYFMVITETGFFVRLKVFLRSLQSGIYRAIQERKYRLLQSATRGLREQAALQGLFTAVLVLGAHEISTTLLGGVDETLLRLTFAAVFFHLSYLTLMTYLFYFQVYRRSALLAALFLVTNLAGSIVVGVAGAAQYAPLPYLLAGLIATGAGLRLVNASARSLDRLLFRSYG